jgi:hypothetical protein
MSRRDLYRYQRIHQIIFTRVLLIKSNYEVRTDRAQLSLLEGSQYEYFFILTNTEFPSEKVFISYEKRGNALNYFKKKLNMIWGSWPPSTKIVLGK